MSWWVYLATGVEKHDIDGRVYYEPKAIVKVDHHAKGGTYVVGGIDLAELNITYNYGGYFREHLGGEGLWDLDGQRAGDWIDKLERAVAALGTNRDKDYWAKTPGNAGYALSILLGWAKQCPDAFFVVH